jgi:TP901 family phage tail tape measure protein
MAERTQFIIQTVAELRGLRQATKEMSIAEAQSRRLASTLSANSKFIEAKVGDAWTKSGRHMAKTTAIFEDNGRKIKVVTGQVGKVSGVVSEQISGIGKSAKGTVPLLKDFQKALARVIIVAPVWFLFRQTISSVFRTIRDGIKDIVAFDKALQKAKRNLQGSSVDIARNFKNLREEVIQLSLDTGESVENITNAFQKFATVGFDFETSLEGANNAVKLAGVLFGNSVETANAFARSMRVMVDESDNTKTAGEQIAEAMALTAELWKTNAFEINEFTQSMENFASTAKTSNLTTKESIVLLATLGTGAIRGARGGRLLRSSIGKLIGNLDKLAKTLGVEVNEELDSTFDVLLRVIDAIAELRKQSKLAPEASKAIAEIFGGIRGGQPVRALVALRDELRKNLELTGDVSKLNDAFAEVTDTIQRQAQILGNLKKEVGKAFVVGLTDADNFLDSLKGINKWLEKNRDGFEALGTTLRQFFAGAVVFMPTLTILDFEADMQNAIGNLHEAIVAGLHGNLSTIELKSLVVKIAKLDDKELKKLKLSEQTLTQLANQLSSQLNAELKKTIEQGEGVEAEVPVIPKVTISDIQDTYKAIVSNELEILKSRGATNSELSRTKNILHDQLGIEESTIDVLKRELQIEREINEERRLRKDLSSDTLKLFRIAQTEGTGVAEKIGDVLSGQVDFNTFVRQGGKELEIFKQQFADLFEQQQALAFFKGDRVPGLEGLRGGSRIAIQEEQIRRSVSPVQAQAQIRARRAVAQIPEIKADIQNRIQVSIDISGLDASQIVQKTIDETKKEIINEMDKPNSEMKKKLDDHIGNY